MVLPRWSGAAYTATPVPTREEALSTNHDVYTVTLATGERRQITTNPAADRLPRYSPDGRFLAYRAQEHAGFEADPWLGRSPGGLVGLLRRDRHATHGWHARRG